MNNFQEIYGDKLCFNTTYRVAGTVELRVRGVEVGPENVDITPGGKPGSPPGSLQRPGSIVSANNSETIIHSRVG
jgi:hypothetical protein